jgi:hypothetical protein
LYVPAEEELRRVEVPQALVDERSEPCPHGRWRIIRSRVGQQRAEVGIRIRQSLLLAPV